MRGGAAYICTYGAGRTPPYLLTTSIMRGVAQEKMLTTSSGENVEGLDKNREGGQPTNKGQMIDLHTHTHTRLC